MKQTISTVVLPLVLGLVLISTQQISYADCPNGDAPASSKMYIVFKNNSDKDFLVRGTSWPVGKIPFSPGNELAKAHSSTEITYSNSQTLCTGNNTFAAWITDPNGTNIRLQAIITVAYLAHGMAYHNNTKETSPVPLPGYVFSTHSSDDQTKETTLVTITKK